MSNLQKHSRNCSISVGPGKTLDVVNGMKFYQLFYSANDVHYIALCKVPSMDKMGVSSISVLANWTW